MNRRLVLVLLCATVVGLVASLFVYRVILQVAVPAPGEGSEQIVVAAANMSLADTVTSQHVKLVAWPKSSIPAGAIRSLAEAEGRVVRSSIVAGEPLLDAKLAPQLAGRGGVMPMLVPEGQRGVTIKVDEAIRESGFVLPNSRVDVLVSMAKPGAQSERIAKVILQDVPILAAGQTVEMRDNKPVTVTTVTLSLTPDQTERLTLAQTEGRLVLTTRNLKDNQLVRTPGITASTLLGDAPAPPREEPKRIVQAPRPRPAPAVASEPLPQPKVQTHAVSVVRGSRVSEQVFVRIEDQQWVERAGQPKN
jgi:pilus assembly protein CpaB